MATTDTQTDTRMALAPDDDAQREPMATADDHTEAKPKKTRKKSPLNDGLRIHKKSLVKLAIFWDDLAFLEEYIKWRVEAAQQPAENELSLRYRVEAEFLSWTCILIGVEQQRVSKAKAKDHSEAEPKKYGEKSADPTLPKIFRRRRPRPFKPVKLAIYTLERDFFDGYVQSMIETEPKYKWEMPHYRRLIEAGILNLTCRWLKKDPEFLEWKESQNQGGNEET
jgi:hypothetical protein